MGMLNREDILLEVLLPDLESVDDRGGIDGGR